MCHPTTSITITITITTAATVTTPVTATIVAATTGSVAAAAVDVKDVVCVVGSARASGGAADTAGPAEVEGLLGDDRPGAVDTAVAEQRRCNVEVRGADGRWRSAEAMNGRRGCVRWATHVVRTDLSATHSTHAPGQANASARGVYTTTVTAYRRCTGNKSSFSARTAAATSIVSVRQARFEPVRAKADFGATCHSIINHTPTAQCRHRTPRELKPAARTLGRVATCLAVGGAS